MANKEKIIIELDFKTDEFTSQAATLNKEIKKLNDSQKELKKDGKDGSLQFAENANELRKYKKDLRETNKVIDNLSVANGVNADSNDALKAKLSIMTLEYNSLTKAQKEGTKRGQELKSSIAGITETLKGNETEVGNNTREVGNYKKANEGLTQGFGKLDEATGSYGSQLKALLANPVVLVITGIVAAFALLKKAFTRNEDGANKYAKVQAILSGVMSAFMDVVGSLAETLVDLFSNPMESLKRFADAIKQNVINRFEGMLELIPALGKAIGQVFSGDFSGAGETAANAVGKVALGVTDIVGKVKDAGTAMDEFGRKVEENAAKAAKLADAEASLVRSQRNLRILQLEFLKDAEKQRQIRDDESLSIAERTAANEKLGEILKEQSKQELAIANKALAVANMRIAIEGESSANLDERATALEGIADINERITGQESEQLVNINSLKRDALALDKEILAQKEADAKIAMDIAIANAQGELDAIKAANQSKIEEGKFLNDTLYQQEIDRLTKVKDAELLFQEEKLAQGAISQEEYNAAINTINEENSIALGELAVEKKEADAEAAIIDLENKRETDILNNEYNLEQQKKYLDSRLEEELKAAKKNGADTQKIKDKYEAIDKKNNKTLNDAKLQSTKEVFSIGASLAKEGSKEQKALALTAALINTYQGIAAGVALGYPAAIPAVAAAALTGFGAVRNITSTKAAKGGIFGGNLHSSGGTKGYFDDGTQIEVERDELFMVINRNSTDMINRMSNINELGGGIAFGNESGSSFADGGIAIGSVTNQVNSEEAEVNRINAIMEAQPQPVVIVQDINEVQGATADVVNRSIL